jgi:hypothetical protein
VDAWRLQLDPQRWAEAGTLSPSSTPRSLDSMRDNFTGLFAPQSLRERLLFELPFQMMHWGHGFFYYKLVPRIRKLIWVNKRAMWVRRFLVSE